MFFNYFRKRKLKQTFAHSCATIIRMQFVVSQELPPNHADDPWVLGYIYGACTAIFTRMGVEPSPEAYEILHTGFAAIFGSDLIGKKILSETMGLRSDPMFIEAQDIGGNEILRQTPDGPLSFALGTYLGENKSPEIKERLRNLFR